MKKILFVLVILVICISPASAAIKACLACNNTCGGDTSQFPWLNGTRALTGIWDFGGFNLSNIGSPVADTDCADKAYVDSHSGGGGGDDLTNYLARNGTWAMTGNLSMGSNWINGLGDPTDPQDAATKYYVDTHGGTGGNPFDQELNTSSGVQFANTTYYTETQYEDEGNQILENDTTFIDPTTISITHRMFVDGVNYDPLSPIYGTINRYGAGWESPASSIGIDNLGAQFLFTDKANNDQTIMQPNAIYINSGETGNSTTITPDGITTGVGETVCTNGNGACGDPTACAGYPPGAVYGSTTGIDPATELGCGLWQNKTMLGDITFWERVLE